MSFFYGAFFEIYSESGSLRAFTEGVFEPANSFADGGLEVRGAPGLHPDSLGTLQQRIHKWLIISVLIGVVGRC
jgi:hypothetical protein